MHKAVAKDSGSKAVHGGARIRSAELDQYRGRFYKEMADCTLCGQHFDDFDCYKAHLKQHFVEDPKRTWGRCNEKGCDSSKRIACFMSHLCVNHGMLVVIFLVFDSFCVFGSFSFCHFSVLSPCFRIRI